MALPIRAPELPDGLTWLQAERPPVLHEHLAGKVTALVFWTSSCIHSQLALASIAWLEQHFAGAAFAALSVHTGKFAREREPEHVRLQVARLGVRHPVAVDDAMRAWRAYECRAWPTLVLVDARGAVRFRGAGEPDRERAAAAIEALLREGGAAAAALAQEPHGAARRGPGVLAFPEKLAVDAARGWLWISDTGHHRVIACDLASGVVQRVAGCGLAGASDGALCDASFDTPRGLAVRGDTVFVADSHNHLVRAIDVAEQRVRTVLGTGRQENARAGGGHGVQQGICAPLDVCVHDDALYVAMGGLHQIWRMDLSTRAAAPFAGIGGAGLLDGPTMLAELAQTSGLAAHGRALAFVDAATSSVRVADLGIGMIETLCGTSPFRYGDLDGPTRDALLQSPLGIAAHGEDLIVADALNAKIKRVARAEGRIETLLGAGARLVLPTGVAVHEDRLFVADAGAHRVLVCDLAKGTFAELAIQGLPDDAAPGAEVVLCARAGVRLRVELPLPQGASLVPGTPVVARCASRDGAPLALDVAVSAEVEGSDAIVRIPSGDAGEGTFELVVRYATSHDPRGARPIQELRRLVHARLVEVGPDVATIR